MGKEILNNSSKTPDQETKESPLDNMPSFKEHIKRNHQEKLQRFMELSGVQETRKNKEQFNESLQQLTLDSAYNYLNHVNGILRGVGKKERGRRDHIHVGDHVAPPAQVQGIVLSETVDALKDIDNNKYRAALSYYIVNGLHMFPDGNGRTSRAVYEIFENSNFNLASAESLAHHSQDQSYGHRKFEKEKGIAPSSYALALTLTSLKSDLVNTQKISPRLLKAPTRVEIIYGREPDVYLTEDATKNLSSKEKWLVNRAFMDGDIAIVALARMLELKGTFDEVADANTRDYNGKEYVAIEILKKDLDTSAPNELAQKTFQGWTAKDYRNFVRATYLVQKMQYEKLIDFFKTPDSYRFNDGTRVADYLSDKQK